MELQGGVLGIVVALQCGMVWNCSPTMKGSGIELFDYRILVTLWNQVVQSYIYIMALGTWSKCAKLCGTIVPALKSVVKLVFKLFLNGTRMPYSKIE